MAQQTSRRQKPAPDQPATATAPAIRVDVPVSVTINRAVELTGLPRSTIYELIGNSPLRVSKIGRRTLITYESLRELVEKGVRDWDTAVRGSIKRGRAILAAEKRAAQS